MFSRPVSHVISHLGLLCPCSVLFSTVRYTRSDDIVASVESLLQKVRR